MFRDNQRFECPKCGKLCLSLVLDGSYKCPECVKASRDKTNKQTEPPCRTSMPDPREEKP